ncbi:hypothetical protein VTL71DRAFT_3545 [Oculimacula yallundae]|uniref:Uncharacterized protein n=1 Tax=Oculimacula yallundae TaxID=86028 RepID=A0ABR4C816_9HELO
MSDSLHKEQDDSNRKAGAAMLFPHSPAAQNIFSERFSLTIPPSFSQNESVNNESSSAPQRNNVSAASNVAPQQSSGLSRSVSPAFSQGSAASHQSSNAPSQAASAAPNGNHGVVRASIHNQLPNTSRQNQTTAPRNVAPLLSQQALEASSLPKSTAGYIAFCEELRKAGAPYKRRSDRLGPEDSVRRVYEITSGTVYTTKFEQHLSGVMAGHPMINSSQVIMKLAHINEGLSDMLDDGQAYIRRLHAIQAQMQASQTQAIKQAVNKAVRETVRPPPQLTEQHKADLLARDHKIKAMENFIKDQAQRFTTAEAARDLAQSQQREKAQRLLEAENMRDAFQSRLDELEQKLIDAETAKDLAQKQNVDLQRSMCGWVAAPELDRIQGQNHGGDEQQNFGPAGNFDMDSYHAQNQAQSYTQGHSLVFNHPTDSASTAPSGEGEDQDEDANQEQEQGGGSFSGLQHAPQHQYNQSVIDAKNNAIASGQAFDLTPPRFSLYAHSQNFVNQQVMNGQQNMMQQQFNGNGGQQIMGHHQGLMQQQGLQHTGEQCFNGQGMSYQQAVMQQQGLQRTGEQGFNVQQDMGNQQTMMHQQQGAYNAGQPGYGSQQQMFGFNGMEDPFYTPPVPSMYPLGNTHTPGRQQLSSNMQSPTRAPSAMRAPNSAPAARRRHPKMQEANTNPGGDGKITLAEHRDKVRKDHEAKRQQQKLINAKKHGYKTTF